MGKVFHIRAPRPRNGMANSFYPVQSAYHPHKTLCGSPVTFKDIKFDWQAFEVGNYVPCPDCIEARRRHRANARKANA
jgi:hypothetical protein